MSVYVIGVHLASKMAKDCQVQVVVDYVVINLLWTLLRLLVLEGEF